MLEHRCSYGSRRAWWLHWFKYFILKWQIHSGEDATVKAEGIYNLTSPMTWQRQEAGSDLPFEMWSRLFVKNNTLFFSWKLEFLSNEFSLHPEQLHKAVVLPFRAQLWAAWAKSLETLSLSLSGTLEIGYPISRKTLVFTSWKIRPFKYALSMQCYFYLCLRILTHFLTLLSLQYPAVI